MDKNSPNEVRDSNLVDIKHILLVLWKNAWVVAAAAVLGAAAAYGVSKLQTPIYSARTQAMVTRSNTQSAVVGDLTQTLNNQQVTQTYIELLGQDWMLAKATELTGANSVTSQVSVSAASNTQIITIIVTDPSPEQAAKVADALVQVLISENDKVQAGRYTDAEKNLDVQVSQIKQQIDDTQKALTAAQDKALKAKLDDTQKKIQTAQQNISQLTGELAQLTPYSSAANVIYTLQLRKNDLAQQQAAMDILNVQLEAVKRQLAIEKDPIIKANLTTLLSEKEKLATDTTQKMDGLQQEIDKLSPLSEPGVFQNLLDKKQGDLTAQQDLLYAYQQTYTSLVVKDNVKIDNDETASLQKDLGLYQQIYLNLLNNREVVRLNQVQNMPGVVQLIPAKSLETPISPRTLQNTMLGGAAGLILVMIGLLVLDSLDTTLKSREDIQRVVGVPVLGYSLKLEGNGHESGIPYVTRLPRSPAAESFRSLRTNLEFSGVDAPIKSIVVSSPGAGEGKTTVAANLGAIIAQSGKRVLIIDADLRRPRLHHEMGLPNHVGLSSIFREKISLDDVCQEIRDTSLFIITSGELPPNPSELLGSEKMKHILAELEQKFDFVIVDSAPAIVTDSLLIAAKVDGVLMVIQRGQTSAEAARLAAEQYRRVGAKLLGIVANRADPGDGGYGLYGKHKYYEYSSTPVEKTSRSWLAGLFNKMPKPVKKS